MNDKIKFILPRVLGLTLLAGVALFILSIVFKLLLVGLVVAGIGTLIAKIVGKRSRKQMRYENIEYLPYHHDFPEQKSVFSQISKEDMGIIPIQ
ncbi:hypothetical protein [Chryseobacterium sp. PMSZPI]|uniref:hypothetical protein n=1 Tax=Chryseobacterium sp. PMSZPI TaxID=1033900 RepID=UPI000C332FD8|nr:hypothetical protein [Chryseobacterium sp. PMSZPI]PKF72989.1 hypothetical protein CW752_15495 [Chryseobacterium sp. PMSZPI]